MKKNLSAIAVAGLLSVPVFAADGVEFYGVLSAGVVSAHGFGDGSGTAGQTKQLTAMSDQGHSSNRWGIKGTEDLGSGLKAKFMLESNLSLRTGAAGKDSGGTSVGADPLFDREANIALASKEWGEIKLGRGKNFLYNVLDEFDARGNWNFGGLKPIARYAGFYSGSGISRFDSMVRYTSPSYGGLVFDAALSVGDSATNSSNKTAFGTSNVGVRYDTETFSVAYTHENLLKSSSTTNEKIDLVAAKYKLGDLALHGGYASTSSASTQYKTTGAAGSLNTVDNRTNANTYFLGAVYKYTDNVKFNAGYYDVSIANSSVNNVSMFAVGATYSLSKRTELYIDYANAQRKSGATYVFTIFDRFKGDGNPSESTASQNGVNVGVQHRF